VYIISYYDCVILLRSPAMAAASKSIVTADAASSFPSIKPMKAKTNIAEHTI